jgi:hypothetical protein
VLLGAKEEKDQYFVYLDVHLEQREKKNKKVVKETKLTFFIVVEHGSFFIFLPN